MSGRGGGNRYERLAEDEGGGGRRRRPRGEGGNTAAWLLGLSALVFLAWAIATTVIAANRVDPPGRFQCGAATGVDGDLCYDVVIVGGGTAGLAAARKISEDPTLSVLVIEEGPDYAAWDQTILDIGSFFPGYFGIPIAYPNKYYYQTLGVGEPGLAGSQHIFFGGRTLGGSSSENYMIMFRGSDQYWDNFDAAVGSPGTFTAAAVHSTYQEFEWLNDHGRYASTPTRGNGQTPGQTWKLDVFPANNITGYDEERMGLLMSGALGLPMYTDQSYNNPGYTYGVFPYMEFFWDFNTSNPELRWTSRAAFAGPDVMNQETYIGNYPRRLSMFLNSTVFKLLHAPGPVFTGVQFRGRDGIVRNAYAAKEVIVSTGVNTAALMLRSGIGPASVLQSAGVTPVLVNNNLGQKMYSHVGTSIVAVWNNITGINPDGTPVVPFTATCIADTTPSAVPGQRGFELNNIAFAPGLMLIGFGKMHQLSYGSSEIYTGDPLQLQKMITNVLTDPADLTSYRKMIRDVIWGINNQNPGIFIVSIDNSTLNSDALLDEWLSQNAFPLNHYFMNTNMGTDPATSVLNNRFQVWNARNLRVCDTQAYATLVDGHPSYSAALLGQICGKMVLEDHGSPAAKAAHPVHRKPANNKRKAPPTSPQKRDIVAPSEHSLMKRDDAALWGEYQHAIQQIVLKFTASQRDQLLSAIRKTSEYARLCAMYCQQ